MATISKPTMQRRLDKIKMLILSNHPFQDELFRLYVDLRLTGRHSQVVQVFQLLSLYLTPEQHNQLYHPVLLQAFISLKMYPQARACAAVLTQQFPADPEVKKLTAGLKVRTESNLPSYTALATLSRYAVQKPSHASEKAAVIPTSWQSKWQQITPEKLTELGYSQKQKQLARIAKKYRSLVQEQFDQVIFNYLLGYTRAVVVLGGALLELLLAIYLTQTYPNQPFAPTGQKAKDPLDLSLSDLLLIYTQKNLLPPAVLRLCRVARMKRNYIHIGKEILEQHPLQPADSQLCLLAVLETMDALFPKKK